MSAIDTIDHVHVGSMNYLPLYWINTICHGVDITDRDQDMRIELDQGWLSLGGGSGEHPALLINIESAIKSLGNFVWKNKIIDEFIDEHWDELFRHYDIDSNQWPLSSFFKLQEYLETITDWEIGKDGYEVDEVILNCVGMFAIRHLPLHACKLGEVTKKFAELLNSQSTSLSIENECSLNDLCDTIKLIDRNDNADELFIGGKIIKNGNVVWGYTLEDWKVDNQGK